VGWRSGSGKESAPHSWGGGVAVLNSQVTKHLPAFGSLSLSFKTIPLPFLFSANKRSHDNHFRQLMSFRWTSGAGTQGCSGGGFFFCCCLRGEGNERRGMKERESFIANTLWGHTPLPNQAWGRIWTRARSPMVPLFVPCLHPHACLCSLSLS
jgi:hypothetical protein